MYTKNNMHKHNKGFTLVELLIVIVVIAILAAITVVVYNGLSSRANDAAIKSEIANVDKKIRVFQELNGKLPTTLQCPETSEDACINTSSGVALNYSADNSTNPPTYTLTATRGNIQYASNGVDAPVKRTAYTVNNMVTNGDFSSGFGRWQNNSRSPSTAVISGGQLTVNAVSGGRSAVPQYFYDKPCNDQDKIYHAVSVKRISGTDFTVSHLRGYGGYEQSILSASQFNSLPAGGSFSRFSSMRTCLHSQSTFTCVKIASYTSSLTFQAVVDNFIVINLTKDFGAGNEPTAAQMDSIIRQQVPGEFFDGKTTVYK
jgi:prepilin-type N-terminal cleavage/methylation domain-containing protein